MQFVSFPKMPRLTREVVITEKIDGTNAQINIERLADPHAIDAAREDANVVTLIADTEACYAMRVGSRTRWIKPSDDNFAFASWASKNAEELITTLGPGAHFGEWYGSGIQRNYGLDHRRFALFNVSRWSDPNVRPTCCEVVPTLYRGTFTTGAVELALEHLAAQGSVAAPGFMKPEGVIIFHTAASIGFKKTLDDDGVPKSKARVA